MTARRAFMSSTAAATALAVGLIHGAPAFAEEAPPSTTATVQIEPSASWGVDPYSHPGLIGGAAVVFMALSLYMARRRMRQAFLWAGAGAAVTGAWLNPVKDEPVYDIRPGTLVIAIDRSASQTIDGRAALTQRALDRLSAHYGDQADIKIEMVDIGDAHGGGAGTRIFTALDDALDAIPGDDLSGVIVLSDGQIHDVPAQYARLQPGVPLHALISGRVDEYDRRIVVDQWPRFPTVGDAYQVSFRIIDDGPVPDQGAARVMVRAGDGAVVRAMEAKPGETIHFSATADKSGPQPITIEIDPLSGELTDLNNRVVLDIHATPRPLNILMISGSATRNARLLSDIFRANPENNLTTITMLRPPEKHDITPLRDFALLSVPVRELFSQNLNNVDLIVFDQYVNSAMIDIAYQRNIANYISGGGSALVLSGPEFTSTQSLAQTPIGAHLPLYSDARAADGAFVPFIPDDGARHPVMRDIVDMSWGAWYRVIPGTLQGDPAQTRILMRAGEDGSPLLTLGAAGQGRVAMLMSDNLHLWARGHDGGGPHAKLIQQTTRWLTRDPAMEEHRLNLTHSDGKLIVEQQTIAPVPFPVEISSPDGGRLSVVPDPVSSGVWRTTVDAPVPGWYTAHAPGSSMIGQSVAVAHRHAVEFDGALSTDVLLRPVVESTGGIVARMADENIPELSLRDTSEKILREIHRTPIVPNWVWMAMFLACFGGAYWNGRKPDLAVGGSKSWSP